MMMMIMDDDNNNNDADDYDDDDDDYLITHPLMLMTAYEQRLDSKTVCYNYSGENYLLMPL